MIKILNDHSSIQHQYQPEIIKGEIIIGNERTSFQEILRDWFFTCLSMGTMLFSLCYCGMSILIRKVIKHVKKNRQPIDLNSSSFEDPSYNLNLDENDLHDFDFVDDDEDDFISLTSQQSVDENENDNGSRLQSVIPVNTASKSDAEILGGDNPRPRQNSSTLNDDHDESLWEDIR